MEKTKIFIVDDDLFWITLLTRWLTGMGFREINYFSTGEECISQLSLDPDLIFLDKEMKGMNGFEVLKQIRLSGINAGVIFCTAYDDVNMARRAMQEGCHNYISKSICTNDTLKLVINEMNDYCKNRKTTHQ